MIPAARPLKQKMGNDSLSMRLIYSLCLLVLESIVNDVVLPALVSLILSLYERSSYLLSLWNLDSKQPMPHSICAYLCAYVYFCPSATSPARGVY
jgi:hypothetical protein